MTRELRPRRGMVARDVSDDVADELQQHCAQRGEVPDFLLDFLEAHDTGGTGPPLGGLSQLPRVRPREAKADPVEPAFRQAHGLNALRPMCRTGCFLAPWFGGAHCRLCQALAFIAFRRDFHTSPPLIVYWARARSISAELHLGIRQPEVFEGDSQ